MSTSRSSFPSSYAHLGTPLLLDAYRLGPDRLATVLDGLSPTDLDFRRTPEKWSTREIVVHVGDSEIMGAGRIRQAISQSERQFAFYLQDTWAHELDYQSSSEEQLAASVEMFGALRRTTYPLFARCSASDWKKTGIHPEMGEISVRQLLELYADHSERHLDQILVLRAAMSKPIALPELLPKRLY